MLACRFGRLKAPSLSRSERSGRPASGHATEYNSGARYRSLPCLNLVGVLHALCKVEQGIGHAIHDEGNRRFTATGVFA